jgi:ADP-heptose:LPS heptosyltransferase
VAAVLAGASAARDMSALAPGGATTLGQTAALLEAADLFLGNDTGIAHLAAAVGTPVVVVFGPTDPRRYGPLPGSGVAVAPEAGSGPAAAVADRLRDARGSRAVASVSVERVWAAMQQHLVPGQRPVPTGG